MDRAAVSRGWDHEKGKGKWPQGLALAHGGHGGVQTSGAEASTGANPARGQGPDARGCWSPRWRATVRRTESGARGWAKAGSGDDVAVSYLPFLASGGLLHLPVTGVDKDARAPATRFGSTSTLPIWKMRRWSGVVSPTTESIFSGMVVEVAPPVVHHCRLQPRQQGKRLASLEMVMSAAKHGILLANLQLLIRIVMRTKTTLLISIGSPMTHRLQFAWLQRRPDTHPIASKDISPKKENELLLSISCNQ